MTKLSKAVELSLKTIKMEAEAVSALSETVMSSDFAAAIELIYKNHGRVVVTGIGKSAIIAQKITATLNSTGTPSLFLHAADAVHGDLGVIQHGDVIVCISKSGNTPEINVLVSLIKQMDNPLIAITADRHSNLGRSAAHCLVTPIMNEADPNNLAPTTSSTAQLAIGDALAMGLLHMNDFGKNDFARVHPGGTLGKQLHLKVGQMCEQHEKPFVSLESNIQEVIVEITSKRLGATVVIDQEGMLYGIITDGDLRRMLGKHESWTQLKAKDIMSPAPKSIQSTALATEAFGIMRKHSITQLPVLDGHDYLGMVHLHDMIKEGIPEIV